MAVLTPELKKALEEEVTAWAETFITQRHNYLVKKEIKASGQLTQSLRSELLRTAIGDVRTLLIHFAKHGRFIDMRPAKGGTEYVEGLIAWIKAKGLENDFIVKAWSQYGKRIHAKILNDIAWGIILTRNAKHKRRRWYNKPKEAALLELQNRLLVIMPSAAGTDMKDLLTQNKMAAK